MDNREKLVKRFDELCNVIGCGNVGQSNSNCKDSVFNELKIIEKALEIDGVLSQKKCKYFMTCDKVTRTEQEYKLNFRIDLTSDNFTDAMKEATDLLILRREQGDTNDYLIAVRSVE